METNKRIFDIDLNCLEDEWMRQPKLYFKYAEQLAEARTAVKEAETNVESLKTELKETEARLNLTIQENPEQYNITGKATIAAINAAVLVSEKYKKAKARCSIAQQALNGAWELFNNLQSVIHGLDMKKSALENIVKLHGQNYFSTPYIPHDEKGRQFVDDAKKRNARVKKKRKKL